MRTMSLVLAASLALSAASPAQAQSGVDAMQTASARLQAEQAQAQANAVRPGDEQLTCDQIQAEMGVTMGSDEMQAQTAEIDASVQRQQALGQEAQQRMQGMMTTGIVAGIIGSVVPGAGYVQGALMQAQASQAQATADEHQHEMTGMIGNMSNMMPAMMRGQRLYELAQAQECGFVEDMPAN